MEVIPTALACFYLLMGSFKILLMFKLDQHNLQLNIKMITNKQRIVFLMSKIAVENLHFMCLKLL